LFSQIGRSWLTPAENPVARFTAASSPIDRRALKIQRTFTFSSSMGVVDEMNTALSPTCSTPRPSP
jgi:hypothetical protein